MQAGSSTSCGQQESSRLSDKYRSKCRCCLAVGKHEYDFGKAELEMLMENLNLFLMTDPRLPHALCTDCAASLHEVQRFRQRVVASERELRRAITEDFKFESTSESSLTDPLEINCVKTEHDCDQILSVNSAIDDGVLAENSYCKTVKIELEPCGETSKDGKRKTAVKTENNSSSNNKAVTKTRLICAKSRKSQRNTQGPSLAPKDKELRLVPLNREGLRVVPKSSKGLHLLPINSKDLSLAHQSSKELRLLPINSKDLRLLPRNKGIRLIPINSKDLRVVPQSKEVLCVPESDIAMDTKNENEETLCKNNRKRRIKDGNNETTSKKKKCNSESDISESNEEKIDVKTALSNIETTRHLLLKDNNKVRSNIILLLKHSTILPFRNNFKYAFKCFYCDELYIPFKELKEHIETEHNDVSETAISKIVRSMQNLIVTADISCIKCRSCEMKCDSIEMLIEHLCNVHEKVYHETDRKPSHGILGVDLSTDTLKCHICNQDHTFFKNLLVHMNEHYGVFVCYVCGKKFLSERRYKSHVISTHANEEINCNQCSKVFKTEPAMKYHVKRVHLKTRVKCLYCPETFTSGNYVKRLNHMADVHGITKPTFKCDLCGKELANSASLAHHKMYTHKRAKVNKCEICGYMTCSNSAMKNHMIVHSGEKNYECEFCKKRFAKPGTLTLHVKIHYNDKRFVCSLCDAAFIQKNSLKNHLRSRHPDSGIDINSIKPLAAS